MKFVPKGLSRLSSRSLLKLNASSPTILVVAGVVGLGATAVLAAKATRDIDPILEDHQKGRAELSHIRYSNKRDEQKDLLNLYVGTTTRLGRLYGPTILLGTTSAVSVLGGHKILRGRHVATMAAYSSLFEQFKFYRGRVAKSVGEEMEQSIYDGAYAEWVEDPDHKGEYKLKPHFDKDTQDREGSYLRPWFDETNVNWTRDAGYNYLFLKGVQAHMNRVLQIRGHVFLNDVCDALKLPRTREGQISGWLYGGDGDDFIDFGFMASQDPAIVAFRNGVERSVRLNFNIDGSIWNRI